MMTKDTKDPSSEPPQGFKGDASDAIGSQLKQYYKSVEQEPVPDHLLDLLEKLDQAERSGGSNGTA
ncbi:MAG: NepR family anti-sigma factor [Hoeflea sp.]|uniref:NepR family anti-sigma factor n=1 Tax=Hoeflea sp. TaxID=1940281 RepID=UPI0032F07B5B